jgi:uncharacterized protein YqeY
MTLRQRILDDLTAAMKAGARQRLDTLRMVKARIQEAEVALRATKGLGYELSDAEATQVLASYAKQRRDSIESFRQAGRADLAAREEAELAIVQEYLPRQLDADALRRLAREAIAEAGATSAKDVGRVMKLLMPKVKGAADGKEVNRVVGELLGGG